MTSDDDNDYDDDDKTFTSVLKYLCTHVVEKLLQPQGWEML